MPTPIHIHTVDRGALYDLAAEWRDKIKPQRIKFDFRVEGGWKVEATNQFVWLLSYDGTDEWEVCNQAFYQPAERRSLDPDPESNILLKL